VQKIFIVVQNLKIGGFQRVALDEAYAFSAKGYEVVLITLEELEKDGAQDFYSSEIDLIEKFKIKIKVINGYRWQQLISFIFIIKHSNVKTYFISHNLRASVLIRLASIILIKKVKIFTVIHQVPSLSDRIQRLKRFLYARVSNKLFIFSLTALKDWEEKVNSNLFLRILYLGKRIELLRNGVFFERINSNITSITTNSKKNLRLIFIGRPTFWKGFDIVLALANTEILRSAKVVFYVPYTHSTFFDDLPKSLTDRLEIVIGKTFRDYVPRPGDVHLYPTNYGSSEFIESISINCLEMASVGVQSCVTQGGLDTWPEFRNHPLIKEINWFNLNEAAKSILLFSQIQVSTTDILQVRDLININNHLKVLTDSFGA
jgi:hypothetical protein